MAEVQTFYVIYNENTEDVKCVNETRTMPALYRTYGIAKGILKTLQHFGRFQEYCIREAELRIR